MVACLRAYTLLQSYVRETNTTKRYSCRAIRLLRFTIKPLKMLKAFIQCVLTVLYIEAMREVEEMTLLESTLQCPDCQRVLHKTKLIQINGGIFCNECAWLRWLTDRETEVPYHIPAIGWRTDFPDIAEYTFISKGGAIFPTVTENGITKELYPDFPIPEGMYKDEAKRKDQP